MSLFDRLTIYHAAGRPGLGVELAARYGVTEACISLTRKGRFIGSPQSLSLLAEPLRGECTA